MKVCFDVEFPRLVWTFVKCVVKSSELNQGSVESGLSIGLQTFAHGPLVACGLAAEKSWALICVSLPIG